MNKDNYEMILPHGTVSTMEEINNTISKFIHSEAKILTLSSFDVNIRDQWLDRCLNIEADIPIEKWAHSNRIAKLIEFRTGIEFKSIYQTIYGNPAKTLQSEPQETEELELSELPIEELYEIVENDGLEFVAIKSDKDLPLNALIIIHEAHFISSTKVENDIINFGSGCLLNDLLFHLEIQNNSRKIILIGDPYILSFGKSTDTALITEHLFNLSKVKITALAHIKSDTSNNQLFQKKSEIANAINNSTFNYLNYSWDSTIEEISKEEVINKMLEWFSEKNINNCRVLVYTNNEASQINNWVKNKILKNGDSINTGDLLLTQNNIIVNSYNTGNESINLYNGTFLKVLEIIEILEPISNKKNNVKLEYIKLRSYLYKSGTKIEVKLNVLMNYFVKDELTKDEHIALRILASTKYYELKKRSNFEESTFYKNAISSYEYIEAFNELNRLIKAQENGDKKIKTALDKQEKITKRILKKASKEHNKYLKLKVVREDEFINALYVRHGWAMTVHKSIGFKFDEVIFKADSDLLTGYSNRNYFKWLYTGLSAASKIYLSHPKIISPIDSCKFEDNSLLKLDDTLDEVKKEKLVYPNYIIPNQVKEISGEDFNSNVLACINELTISLTKFGAIIEQIQKKDKYLYKVVYSLQEMLAPNLILAIYNNGKGEVSSVRLEKCPEDIKYQCNQIIEELYKKSSNSLKEDYLLDGFRQQLINSWKEKASAFNLSIKVLECHQYHDFLRIENAENYAKFKMTYNDSGFISGIKVVKKTEDSIVELLKKIIFDEQQN